MLHHVKVEPVRILYDDTSLLVRVRKGIGFRFVCDCGANGPKRNSHAVARLDGIEHREAVNEERDTIL